MLLHIWLPQVEQFLNDLRCLNNAKKKQEGKNIQGWDEKMKAGKWNDAHALMPRKKNQS